MFHPNLFVSARCGVVDIRTVFVVMCLGCMCSCVRVLSSLSIYSNVVL